MTALEEVLAPSAPWTEREERHWRARLAVGLVGGPRFLTRLAAEKVGYDLEGRALWRLTAPLAYLSPRFGLRVVPAGFVTNYASVPRLPVVFLVAGGMADEMAVLHDHAYTIRDLARESADALFLEAMGAETAIPADYDRPVPAWLARLMYQAVRIGGASSYAGPTLVPQPRHVHEAIQVPELSGMGGASL